MNIKGFLSLLIGTFLINNIRNMFDILVEVKHDVYNFLNLRYLCKTLLFGYPQFIYCFLHEILTEKPSEQDEDEKIQQQGLW